MQFWQDEAGGGEGNDYLTKIKNVIKWQSQTLEFWIFPLISGKIGLLVCVP
jgi:hypothetical protein